VGRGEARAGDMGGEGGERERLHEGVGEDGGERGTAGASRFCSSVFCWMRTAFCTCSWVLVFIRFALVLRLSWSLASKSCSFCSMLSVAAFFLSLAVWAATLFLSFLLISRSSGLRWSRLALLRTGPLSSPTSSFSSLMLTTEIGEVVGAGLLLPTTAATGREVAERRGELEESMGERVTAGASFNSDFWPVSIDWGITMICGFCILRRGLFFLAFLVFSCRRVRDDCVSRTWRLL